VPSFRDGIRWASKLKTPAKEFPSPTSESYLPNSAILLDASRTERVPLASGQNAKDRGENRQAAGIAALNADQFDVRYWGQSGHWTDLSPCPLLTQSGHRLTCS
jgi:hypothetical protein